MPDPGRGAITKMSTDTFGQAQVATQVIEPRCCGTVPTTQEPAEPSWYAAHTCANHETKITAHLAARDIEHFLPTYMSVRRWRDRRITLSMPLFPGYVFVRILLRHKLLVEQVPGIARLVGFAGKPAPLPDEEIEQLRAGLSRSTRAEPCPFLTRGHRVRIKYGPFAGMAGILLRRKAKVRVVLSVELIQQSLVVEVDESDVESLR
jgi:transcription termination/antitermination protein NusG